MAKVDVRVRDEFKSWYATLSKDEQDAVVVVGDLLEEHGLQLGYPHSSDVKGTSFALRELRPKAGRSPLRVFYAFDPKRRAIILIGGSKAGTNMNLFYRRMIKDCEAIWKRHLAEKD